MTSSRTTGAHIQRIDNALRPLRQGSPPAPNVVASALTTALDELVQALADMATDIDDVARRLDPLENTDE
jgi:hypothetical protein